MVLNKQTKKSKNARSSVLKERLNGKSLGQGDYLGSYCKRPWVRGATTSAKTV